MSSAAPSRPLRIFLSYGHDANEKLVQRVQSDLERRRHDVWVDRSEIKTGDDWRRQITEGILGSDRVLAFLSKHSTRDPGVCRDEIAIALALKGGNIQTILVEDETDVRPPVNISHVQWLDMHDWQQHQDAGDDWYESKLAEIIRIVESDESRRFAGEIATLAGHLQPLRFDARLHELLRKGFWGRQWLFDSVERWRSEPGRDSRMLWIVGEPGVGKSAVAAQLVQTRADAVIAAHFVEWDKSDHRDGRRIIRSIVFQLATRLPDYRKVLLQLPEIARLDDKDAAELFEYLLANPLGTLIDGNRERFVAVIDALDEAGEPDRNPLVDMLARHASRLPSWLGIIVTSRPDYAVKAPLQGLRPVLLDTRTEENRADLRAYIRDQLTSQFASRSDADAILDRIVQRSEGVFLYTERFCDDVRQGNLSLDEPDTFPRGLGGIFHQWFRRQFPDLEVFRTRIRPALGAILAAREPLRLDLFRRIFNWQDEETRDFARTLGSLFPGIKPYHKALADWLSDRDKADAYFVSITAGHRTLAQWCIREAEADADDYAVRHMAAHCLAARDFILLFDAVTPEFVMQRATRGAISQAFEDNACCLAALAEQGEKANPARRLAHALLAALLRDIAEEGYRSGSDLLERAQRHDYLPSPSPPSLQAAVLLLLAEAAFDAGESATATKLIDDAIALPLSHWSGLNVNAFQAVTGSNLSPDSPFVENLRTHPLNAYLGHIATYDPDAALRIARYVCPRRTELPNLASLWLATLDCVPATAGVEAMERLFTFTDHHIADFCADTVVDLRDFLDRYLATTFQSKDRFSPLFFVNLLIHRINSLLNSCRDAFGNEWAYVRLLRSMAQLFAPPTWHPEMVETYHQCATAMIEKMEKELFPPKDAKVPLMTAAYFLRATFEAGLPVDPDFVRAMVELAFNGLIADKLHAMRLVEPIRVMYPISPQIVEEIADKKGYRLVMAADLPAQEPDDEFPPGAVHVSVMITNAPARQGITQVVHTGPNAHHATAAMWRSKGMLGPRTIIITDPLLAAPPARPPSDDPDASAFLRNRAILDELRAGSPPPPSAASSEWRVRWQESVYNFLGDLLIDAALAHGAAIRPSMQVIARSTDEPPLPASFLEGLMALGDAKAGRILTDARHAALVEAALDLARDGNDYGLTLLAHAALLKPAAAIDALRTLGSNEQECAFWLILFRDLKNIPEELRNTGIERALHLADEVFVGMQLLLLLPESEIWAKAKDRLEDAYSRFRRKGRASEWLCTKLLREADDFARHPRYGDMLADHLERMAAHWSADPNDGDGRSLTYAMSGLVTVFARNRAAFVTRFLSLFEPILQRYDEDAGWHLQRALLFPHERAKHIDAIRAKIESSPGAGFPEELSPLRAMMQTMARASAPDRDPQGAAVASSFADLVEIAYRTSDRNLPVLVDEMLARFPAASTPTIALDVIARTLEIGDVATARSWLPRAHGLLDSAIGQLARQIPETPAGMAFVMEMIAVEASIDIVHSTAGVFAATSVALGPQSVAESTNDALRLLGLVN